jgi:hypothetical protein
VPGREDRRTMEPVLKSKKEIPDRVVAYLKLGGIAESRVRVVRTVGDDSRLEAVSKLLAGTGVAAGATLFTVTGFLGNALQLRTRTPDGFIRGFCRG